MPTFKQLSSRDISTTKSFLNQLVDVIQEDISGSTTRKKYQVYVTGGVGPGVTSSLFQTIFDQDFTLQTANSVLDLTVGLFSGSSAVTGSSTGVDSAGKVLFPSTSMMMREKVSNYRQFAQLLLGDANSTFYSPFSNYVAATSATDDRAATDVIDEALFITFKRLFARDKIKRETFAMKFYRSASHAYEELTRDTDAGTGTRKPNLFQTSESGSAIFTDVGSSLNLEMSYGGNVGNIVNSENTLENVGLMFYDQGIAIMNLNKVISGSEAVSGTVSALNNSLIGGSRGRMVIGGGNGANPNARFIPDFMVSASIDNIVDHFASCRFSSGSNTAMTFQNLTNINSTLIFCRATADEFNYSSNPTYTDSDNKIRVIETGQEATQKAFSFITTVGLYDAKDNLLAVAKLSRPIEKNDEKDLTIRVRLDF